MKPRVHIFKDDEGWGYRIIADWPCDEEREFATEESARAAAEAHIAFMEDSE